MTIYVKSHDNKFMYNEQGQKVAVYSERQCKWFALLWVQKLSQQVGVAFHGISLASTIVTKIMLTKDAWSDLQEFEPQVYACIAPKAAS